MVKARNLHEIKPAIEVNTALINQLLQMLEAAEKGELTGIVGVGLDTRHLPIFFRELPQLMPALFLALVGSINTLGLQLMANFIEESRKND